MLHKIFVSLTETKQELYAKSFQVNDIRGNLFFSTLKTHENLKRDVKDWSCDLQRFAIRGKLGSKAFFC